MPYSPRRRLSLKNKVALAALGTVALLLIAVSLVLSMNLPLLWTNLLLSGIFILIAMAMIRVVSLWVTRPIIGLIAQINRLQRDDGETWSPIELRTGDEIEQLADAFNALMKKTNDAEIELRENTELNRREQEKKHEELESLFAKVEKGKREWEVTLDHLKDFVILTDPAFIIRRYNKLLAEVTGRPITKLMGYEWRELLTEVGFRFVNFDGVQGELIHQPTDRTYDINIYEVRNKTILDGYIVSLKDTTELRAATQQLEKAYAELKDAQMQVYQQEKLASIGLLAAGVAHEINNPMGFVSSNLTTLGKYVERLIQYIVAGDQAILSCSDKNEKEKLSELRKKIKIDHIIGDFPQLIAESRDGTERVRRIVQDLKSFSRSDPAEYIAIDLNEALETTINIAWNEIKYVATLRKEYGKIPLLRCYPQQLNQVFLNLLINAAQAMEGKTGEITIRTWCEEEYACIAISDSGAGIPVEIQPHIFDPFFTTKPVGKGTGLGLSVSYDIVRKHGGEIRLESTPGKGSTFIVRLPLQGNRQEQI